MKQIHECRPIREIFQTTDTKVMSKELSDFAAVVVEVLGPECEVEGTLLYFPSVNAKQLLKGL